MHAGIHIPTHTYLYDVVCFAYHVLRAPTRLPVLDPPLVGIEFVSFNHYFDLGLWLGIGLGLGLGLGLGIWSGLGVGIGLGLG